MLTWHTAASTTARIGAVGRVVGVAGAALAAVAAETAAGVTAAATGAAGAADLDGGIAPCRAMHCQALLMLCLHADVVMNVIQTFR